MPLLTIALVITLLILLHALYVAAEFSIVSSRKARLSHLAEEGNRAAGLMLAMIENPSRLDEYVAS